ncbi:MAG: hypothetical protein RLZZ437_3221 [Pseudomonadota bacterium]
MTQPAPISPYHAPLMAVVDQIYARSPACVPKTLEVCQCPVCMTPETLAEIISTPVRALTAAHLSEYRNSAHGVPNNPDDLRAMLPRYLDLIARDQWFDDVGLGVDLQRFGDGRITHAPLFDPRTDALLNQWAHLMILHTGWSEAAGQDTDYSLLHLTEVLIVGGWPCTVITSALDLVFTGDHGPQALRSFLQPLGTNSINYGHFDFWALPRYCTHAIPDLLEWLRSLLARDLVKSILMDVDPLTDPWARELLSRAPTLTVDAFAAR